jgi:hypothetical protein
MMSSKVMIVVYIEKNVCSSFLFLYHRPLSLAQQHKKKKRQLFAQLLIGLVSISV